MHLFNISSSRLFPHKMAVTVSPWLLPALLTIGCVALLMNLLSVNKVNNSLVESVDKAQAEMKVALDADMECNKQLEMKSSDLTAKDQQLASLTANVDKLDEEKNKLEGQLHLVQEQLDQVNAEKDALAAEKEQLLHDLELAKREPENEVQDKVDAFNEEKKMHS